MSFVKGNVSTTTDLFFIWSFYERNNVDIVLAVDVTADVGITAYARASDFAEVVAALDEDGVVAVVFAPDVPDKNASAFDRAVASILNELRATLRS